MSTQRHCQRTSVSGPWAFPCHKREVTGKLLYPGLRDIVLSQRRTLHDRYKHVVVELGEEEAKASGWRAGYYLIDHATAGRAEKALGVGVAAVRRVRPSRSWYIPQPYS